MTRSRAVVCASGPWRRGTMPVVWILLSFLMFAEGQAPCAVPRRTITFQDGYGGFREESEPNFRWLIHSGPTPTANTGPVADRTGSTEKRYVYAEITNPQAPTATASALTSQMFGRPTGPCEISYYFFSFGMDIGLFRTILNPGVSGSQTVLQTLQPPVQSMNWMKVTRRIETNSNFQIRFSYNNTAPPLRDQGDFALDDITFSETCCKDTWFECSGRQWRYFPDYVSWEVAEGDCVSMDGHLATVSSDQDRACVQQLMPCSITNCPLLLVGLNDQQQEGVYRWIGSPNLVESPTSTNWAPNNPESDTSQNCVALQPGVGLVSVECKNNRPTRQPFICQRDINECSNSTSCNSSTSSCNNVLGSFTCSCHSGFKHKKGSNITCEDVNECSNTSTCNRSMSTCNNIAGSYTCNCHPGFVHESGSNTTCEDIDECSAKTHDCVGLYECVNTFGSFNCVCANGTELMGTKCVDIDECTLDLHDCHANATCRNQEAGFRCVCKTGFVGNGRICTHNDCVPPPCGDTGICHNVPTGYACLCVTGYTGRNCQTDIDECSSSPCPKNASCVDTVNAFTCMCAAGLTGPLCQKDLDECTLGIHDCHSNATCNNTFSTYTCSCKDNFEGNGIECMASIAQTPDSFSTTAASMARTLSASSSITPESSQSSNLPMTIAIACGAGLLVLVAIILLTLLIRRKRRRTALRKASSSSSSKMFLRDNSAKGEARHASYTLPPKPQSPMTTNAANGSVNGEKSKSHHESMTIVNESAGWYDAIDVTKETKSNGIYEVADEEQENTNYIELCELPTNRKNADEHCLYEVADNEVVSKTAIGLYEVNEDELVPNHYLCLDNDAKPPDAKASELEDNYIVPI